MRDGEVEVLLSDRSEERIADRIVELTPRNWGQSLAKCIQGLNEYLEGWSEFFKVCTRGVVQTLHMLDAHIRRRLRAIVLKHWKRRRTMAKRLIKLGVKPRTAWRYVYAGRQRLWALSHCTAVDRGLRNAYFAERGLVFLEEQWEMKHPGAVTAVPCQLMLELG
jgi:RNA-directed DNA polymerase